MGCCVATESSATSCATAAGGKRWNGTPVGSVPVPPTAPPIGTTTFFIVHKTPHKTPPPAEHRDRSKSVRTSLAVEAVGVAGGGEVMAAILAPQPQAALLPSAQPLGVVDVEELVAEQEEEQGHERPTNKAPCDPNRLGGVSRCSGQEMAAPSTHRIDDSDVCGRVDIPTDTERGMCEGANDRNNGDPQSTAAASFTTETDDDGNGVCVVDEAFETANDPTRCLVTRTEASPPPQQQHEDTAPACRGILCALPRGHLRDAAGCSTLSVSMCYNKPTTPRVRVTQWEDTLAELANGSGGDCSLPPQQLKHGQQKAKPRRRNLFFAHQPTGFVASVLLD